MDERKRERFAPPVTGGISLLVVFAVLCLTVFALLSLSTVQADLRLADASRQTVRDYYAADCAAQEILARLRGGEEPEGVSRDSGGICRYSCPISDTQTLFVEVRLGPGDAYSILRWQAEYTDPWEADDSLNLWDGTLF